MGVRFAARNGLFAATIECPRRAIGQLTLCVCRLVAIGGEADIEPTSPKDPGLIRRVAVLQPCGHRSVVSARSLVLVGAKRIDATHALVGQLLFCALVLC